jgi:hypothetical protein
MDFLIILIIILIILSIIVTIFSLLYFRNNNNNNNNNINNKQSEKYDDLTYEAMSAIEAVMDVDTSYTDENYVEYISSTSDQRNYIKQLCNIKD